MFVDVTDYHGNPHSIDPLRVIKIRPAAIAGDDPEHAVLIDYVSNGVFAVGTLNGIVKLFAPYIPLAALHAPDGTPIYVNAEGISAVGRDPAYAGNSVAIVAQNFENQRVPARNKIALRENERETKAALAKAVRSA
jgi:hypothetical protein